MTTAGYSGTPLAKKLGFKEGSRVRIKNAPDDYLGLVDVKVCAVDETWSGLKLVIRKELRR